MRSLDIYECTCSDNLGHEDVTDCVQRCGNSWVSSCLGWCEQAGTHGASQRWAWASKQPNPKVQYCASVSGYPSQQFRGSSPRAGPTVYVVTAQILYIISVPSTDWLLSLCSASSAPIPWWEFSAAFCPWSNPVRLKKKCSISLQSWVIFTRCNYSLTSLHSPWNFALKLSDTASY